MATETKAEAQKASAPKTTVKFTGASVVTRRISAKDFRDNGIEGMKDVEWSDENDHTVDASDWPAEALDLIKRQADFKVSEA